MTFAHIFDLPTDLDPVSGFERQLVQAKTMTLAFIAAKAGQSVPRHAHANEQITLVLDGLFELTIDGETRRMAPGDIGVVEADAPHAGRALRDCVLVEVFSPVRRDFGHAAAREDRLA